VVQNFFNVIEDFQRNDIVLPIYHPKEGTTDFLDDGHMTFVVDYLNFLTSMERSVGLDVRMRMEGYSYESYCQRTSKQLRVDQRKYSLEDDFF